MENYNLEPYSESSALSESAAYKRAQKRIKEIKGFYYSLVTYCLIMPFIIFVNYKTSWDVQWFWFSALGWGMGIAFHAYKVFVSDGILGRKWEERKLEQFMKENERRKRN